MISHSFITLTCFFTLQLPKVSQAVDKFTEVLKACGKSGWSKRALSIIHDQGPTGDISQSLHSIISSEAVGTGAIIIVLFSVIVIMLC